MVYVILFAGVVISIYSLLILSKADTNKDEEKPVMDTALLEGNSIKAEEKEVLTAFKDLLTVQGESIEGNLLYELKEKVELQLSELDKQRELVTHMMMRVEKKLDSQPTGKLIEVKNEEKSDQVKRNRLKDEDFSLNEAALDRARLHNDVYLLYDQEIPLAEIAKQVGLGKGEVELILGLRK